APGAAIPCFTRTAAPSERLKALLEAASCPSIDEALGKELTDAFMPAELQRSLGQELVNEKGHLVVVHDGASATIPWEASHVAGRPLALEFGVSRRHKPTTRAAAKLIERTMPGGDGRLRMLLVYNPTGDLKGAEDEAHALAELFSRHGCEIKVLKREECTKQAVLAELMKGSYDLLHFAGHASFTKFKPEASGILLANMTYLCPADLDELPSVPRLIFLNACQSGRVRGLAAVQGAGANVSGAGGRQGGEDGKTGHASLA